MDTSKCSTDASHEIQQVQNDMFLRFLNRPLTRVPYENGALVCSQAPAY